MPISAKPTWRRTWRFWKPTLRAVGAAGPLSDPSGAAAGGLWLVEADTAAEVERLVRDDPFWPTGLRQSYSILQWTRVFADGARRVRPE